MGSVATDQRANHAAPELNRTPRSLRPRKEAETLRVQRRGDEGSNRGLDQTEEGNDDADDDAKTTTTTMNDDADDGERRET